MENMLPWPGLLVHLMVPPISDTKSDEMARPSPVPPYLRVKEASAWEKGVNKYSCFSGGMPIPVSLMQMVKATREPWSPKF